MSGSPNKHNAGGNNKEKADAQRKKASQRWESDDEENDQGDGAQREDKPTPVPTNIPINPHAPSPANTPTTSGRKKSSSKEPSVHFPAADRRYMQKYFLTNQNPSKEEIKDMLATHLTKNPAFAKMSLDGKKTVGDRKVEKYFWGMRDADKKASLGKKVGSIPASAPVGPTAAPEASDNEPPSAAGFTSEQLRILHEYLAQWPQKGRGQRVPWDQIAERTGLSEIQVIIWFEWHRDVAKQKMPKKNPTSKPADKPTSKPDPKPSDGEEKSDNENDQGGKNGNSGNDEYGKNNRKDGSGGNKGPGGGAGPDGGDDSDPYDLYHAD